MPDSRTLAHLTRLYADSDDPWHHRTSPYEAAKYAQTLRAIGPGPFRHALEIGCGNGSLARHLAPLCRRLTGMDCIPAAAQAARTELGGLPSVDIICGAAPADLPQMRPDLVVLSEVLYFLTPAEITALGHWLRANATGPIVAVDWDGPTDEALDGKQATALLSVVLGAARTTRFTGYTISVFGEKTAASDPP